MERGEGNPGKGVPPARFFSGLPYPIHSYMRGQVLEGIGARVCCGRVSGNINGVWVIVMGRGNMGRETDKARGRVNIEGF